MQKRLLVGGSLAMVGMLILVLCAILGFLRFQYICGVAGRLAIMVEFIILYACNRPIL